MKKTISILLAVCMLAGLLTVFAAAAESGTCGDGVTWTLSDSGRLVISGSGAMDNYNDTDTRAPWFDLRTQIKQVTIENGVTRIGTAAFDRCTQLVSVTVGDDVQSVGYHAFNRCSALRTVSFGKAFSSLDRDAFIGCPALTSIRVAEENTTYASDGGVLYTKGFQTLVYCPRGMTRAVVVPDGCKRIEDYAFQYCAGVTNVALPDTVTYIGIHTFDRCTKLEQIDLSDGLTTIATFAFNECRALKRVDIPGTVSAIGNYAFFDCDALEQVTFHPGLTKIGVQAFEGCDALKTAILPDGVQTIGEGAFMNCAALEEIELPDSIREIGASAFRATGIRHLQLPKNLQVVQSQIAYMCPNLESVSIPEGVQNVYTAAFSDCLNLKTVFFPKSSKLYGLYGFYNCKSLTDVYYSGTRDEWLDFSDRTSSYNTPLLNAPNVHFSHTHDYTDTVVPATCEQGGYTLHVCECSDQYKSDFTEPLPHTYGEWTVVSAPSCTAAGLETRACTECGATETRTSDALGHKWDEGVVTIEPTAKDEGEKTFTCSVCGETCTEAIPAKGESAPSFKDVPSDAYYADAVAWAVGKSITNGTSADTFSPNDTCTRAQVVTFLWRAAGEPEPTKTDNPFTDVQEGAYYYKAVLWAVENNITNGMSADRFEPDGKCTRGQVVTFQHRAAGEPEVTAVNPFSDVKDGDYFFNAVLWAVSKRITNGTTATTFSPNDICTRAQVVTFLYRGANG